MTTEQDALGAFRYWADRVYALEKGLPAIGWIARYNPVDADLHLRQLREAKVAKHLAHEELQAVRGRQSSKPISLRRYPSIRRAVPTVEHVRFNSVVLKSVDKERRELRGWATTPRLDHANDVVCSDGAEYVMPHPLCLQHDHNSAVGKVVDAEVSKRGIFITARIPRVDRPGRLKELVDFAWDSVAHGLLDALSIGFRPIPEHVERMANGGFKYKRWYWHETSIVTCPCNSDAKITVAA